MNSENPRFNLWYCGVTNYENRRKAEHNLKHGLVGHWKYLDAKNKIEANSVERYFSEKGTVNSPNPFGLKENSKWVYIFKIPANRPQGLSGPFNIETILHQLFN